MTTAIASTSYAVTKDLQRPNSPGTIKFVCRWGGDLRPDSQGRQAYDGGETRLCTLPGSVRYRELIQKLREITGFSAAVDMSVKYQIPGHSMDELISIRNSEDLEILKARPQASVKSVHMQFMLHVAMLSCTKGLAWVMNPLTGV